MTVKAWACWPTRRRVSQEAWIAACSIAATAVSSSSGVGALTLMRPAQRQKMGQIEDASQTAEYGDVLQQEADLTAGHGVLRYTGLISISAPTPEELDTAVAAIEQAAIQASCETRRLVGQQAQAFTVAALPLCRTV